MPTRSDLFALARAIGHTDPALYEQRNGKFFVTCSCGYRSTNRFTETDALGAGVHHVLTAAREFMRHNSGHRIDELLHSRAG